MVNSPRIIVSLDYPDMSAAMALAARLDPRHCAVKVGKELFTGNGPVVVEKLVGTGFRVFLDLKFHDIPNTVASACTVAADLGVWMLNIHASGGSRMISAAREALDRFNQRPLLIAVTVLTSFGTDELAELGIHSTVEDHVLRLAHLAETAGIDGVVCSAQEAALLRKEFTDNFCLVTPGIRPKGTPAADQKRVLTPSEAIAAGSDYLVIGRPITQAPDPLKALESIENEVNAALALGGR